MVSKSHSSGACEITPGPDVGEVAAIVAALAALRADEPEESGNLLRDRWRLAGLLGHPPPREMRLHGSLWSFSSWEGMV